MLDSVIKIKQSVKFPTKKYAKLVKKCLAKNQKLNAESAADIALQSIEMATPVESGRTKNSWYYEVVERDENRTSIAICNSHVVNGVNIAKIIDSGHATKDGRWIRGKYYLERPIQLLKKHFVSEVRFIE